jgi:HEAT repeat protein
MPAATAEEAEVTITRLLAEWELRTRRLLLESSGVLPGQPAGPGSPKVQAAREQVIQQLAALGPAALEPLMRRLRPDVLNSLALGRAATAARALGRLGDFRAAPALLAALEDQRAGAAPVRVAAARALGELKAEAAATVYEQALVHQSADDWQVETERLGALHLETVVEALVTALRDSAPEVRAAAADACIDLCLAEPSQTLLRAGGEPSPLATRAGSLQGTSPPLHMAVEPLCRALKDAHAPVRAHAAAALGWVGDQRAAAPLIRCLKDADVGCRAAAAWALGMLRSPLALKPLARALGDASAQVRLQVAESLGELGDPVTTDLLLDALADEEEPLEVRAAAARALGNLHLPQALPVLQELLALPDPALRVAAVNALGCLGFGRAYRLIAPLLWHDPDRAVRHAAARALAQLAEARQSRARLRLRLALRVSRQARKEALALLKQHGRHAHQAGRE